MVLGSDEVRVDYKRSMHELCPFPSSQNSLSRLSLISYILQNWMTGLHLSAREARKAFGFSAPIVGESQREKEAG